MEDELELVSAELATLGPATVGLGDERPKDQEPKDQKPPEEKAIDEKPAEGGPAAGTPIGPGESAVYDLAFPLPAGKRAYDLNLRGLNLRWTIAFGEHKVRTGVNFQRVDWRGWDEDWPHVHVGVGFGYVRSD